MTLQLLPTRRAFLADDPIFALNAEAQARKAGGESVLNATVGALLDDSGQLVILETVMDLWRELTALEVAPYAPIAGDPGFLKALVRRHWPLVPSSGAACATPGGSGALAISLRNFLEPGQSLLTAAPFWSPYGTLAAENGVALATAPWPRAGEALDTGAWAAGLQALMKAQGRILLWLNDPCHNPTGRSLSPADRACLAGLLREAATHGPVTLLLDFAYLDYARDPGAVAAALADYEALGAEGEVLVGASLSISKSLTLYGARCGVLAFPWRNEPTLQAALTQSCRGTWSNCARAPQSLVVRLAQEGRAQEHLSAEHRHWSEVLSHRAAALDEAMVAEGMEALHWAGGFFVCVPVVEPTEVCARMQADGVFTVPLPEGLRVGLCGMRAAEAPRFAQALRRALVPR